MAEGFDSKGFNEKTGNVIVNTLAKLAEGVTGIASSKREDWFLSVGHILQAIRGGQFLTVFLNEWNGYKEKGRIKEDYQLTDQSYTCLHELLDFLDKDIPDETRFNLLKQVFLVASTETLSTRESVLPQQYMKICKTLSTGEVLVLKTTYGVAREDWWKQKEEHFGATRWVATITERSGLAYRELVEIHEQGLMSKRLISPRTLPDGSGVTTKPYFRLTDLGYKICEFVEAYDPLVEKEE